VNNGNGDGEGCFVIDVWTDTAKLSNMVIAGFGEIWSEKDEVFIEYGGVVYMIKSKGPRTEPWETPQD